ncbi:MAG: class I SAM-dependent methyltransferase [Roseburia sp.]|nr:class I SAM-dependent methyltransferase [Roseburia sp.]
MAGNNNQELYHNRFDDKEVNTKKGIWGEVCRYLARYLPSETKRIVDVAAGYCEFINNIHCQCDKVAIDVNPDVAKYALPEIKTVVGSINTLKEYLKEESVSIFFMSNFLEHITKQEISALLQAEYELLEPGGQVWILTPNIRYVGGKYWDFYDHITPITEKSIIEAAMLYGYTVKKCIPRFLPFTTKSRLPQAAWIVNLYLKLMPLSGMVFGEQSFIILQKENRI